MQMSPFKRALRNSVLLSFMIIGIVYYQRGSTQESLLTGLLTFLITFPALWLSFNYTQKVAAKYRVADSELADTVQTKSTTKATNDSGNS